MKKKTGPLAGTKNRSRTLFKWRTVNSLRGRTELPLRGTRFGVGSNGNMDVRYFQELMKIMCGNLTSADRSGGAR